VAKTELAANLDKVRETIARASAKAKRPENDVTLVAVTKYAAPEQIREIIKLGVGDLGESRVQQLVTRAATINESFSRMSGEEGLPSKIRWHMIGSLQRNKVKQMMPIMPIVHSIDSLRLAEELDEANVKSGRKLQVFLQVNASEEPQKHGVAVGAANHLAEQIATMPNLQLIGYMTMAAQGADEATTRKTFARMREIFEEAKKLNFGGAAFKHLSMGMSGDYEAAVLEGATIVRVGSALFGESKPDESEDEE
jgi:PLP dependent protein